MRLFRYSYSSTVYPADSLPSLVVGETTATGPDRARYLARTQLAKVYGCAFGPISLSKGCATSEREHLDRLYLARTGQTCFPWSVWPATP